MNEYNQGYSNLPNFNNMPENKDNVLNKAKAILIAELVMYFISIGTASVMGLITLIATTDRDHAWAGIMVSLVVFIYALIGAGLPFVIPMIIFLVIQLKDKKKSNSKIHNKCIMLTIPYILDIIPLTILFILRIIIELAQV